MRGDGGKPASQRLFGRDDELVAVTSLGSRSGIGLRGAVLQGPAGIGKTALWQAAVANARDNGYCVLIATPSPAEEAISFSGLGDVVRSLWTTTQPFSTHSHPTLAPRS
jgi:hypothetical protein